MRSSMGSFVSFTFSTKRLCGVNQILTVIAVIQIQNLRQAFMSKSRDLMSRNLNICRNTPYKPYTSILKFNRCRSENYRRPSSVNPTEHYARAGQDCKEVNRT
jgi:hypothetical protein